MDILDWFVVAAIALCGFVWLLLPFIVCPRMFDGLFKSPPRPPEPPPVPSFTIADIYAAFEDEQ